MGKLKCFDIQFINNKSVFHPGETIVGTCIINIRGDMKIRALHVYMRAIARVHWTESRSTGTRLGSYTEHYNSEVEYFFKRQTLVGVDCNDTRDTLTDGRHQFDFSFDLPSDGLSTSFEGKHGSIRYWLKAELERPWTFSHKVKKAFTVILPTDINRPEYQMPVECSVDKMLCCWFCASGPITLSARTDRRGYCPGESVAISAMFDNRSSRSVIPYASLHQLQTFFANGKSRIRGTKFTVLTGQPVAAHSHASWDAQLLKIPAVPPSITNCSLIRVDYYVKVALIVSGSYNLSMQLPLVIGTVPYRRIPTFVLPSYQLATLCDVPPASRPPQYGELLPIEAPPTYAESISGAVNIGDDDEEEGGQGVEGIWTYTPMYTYVYDYNYEPPPAYSWADPHTFQPSSASPAPSVPTTRNQTL